MAIRILHPSHPRQLSYPLEESLSQESGELSVLPLLESICLKLREDLPVNDDSFVVQVLESIVVSFEFSAPEEKSMVVKRRSEGKWRKKKKKKVLKWKSF